jgi:excisionase family DNA binding protein
MMTEKLLSKREAAELLGVSEFSMNRLMPEIGFVRVGRRRVLFSPQALQEYIQARTEKPSPRPLMK